MFNYLKPVENGPAIDRIYKRNLTESFEITSQGSSDLFQCGRVELFARIIIGNQWAERNGLVKAAELAIEYTVVQILIQVLEILIRAVDVPLFFVGGHLELKPDAAVTARVIAAPVGHAGRVRRIQAIIDTCRGRIWVFGRVFILPAHEHAEIFWYIDRAHLVMKVGALLEARESRFAAGDAAGRHRGDCGRRGRHYWGQSVADRCATHVSLKLLTLLLLFEYRRLLLLNTQHFLFFLLINKINFFLIFG